MFDNAEVRPGELLILRLLDVLTSALCAYAFFKAHFASDFLSYLPVFRIIIGSYPLTLFV